MGKDGRHPSLLMCKGELKGGLEVGTRRPLFSALDWGRFLAPLGMTLEELGMTGGSSE